VAASLVYRAFPAQQVPAMPGRARQAALAHAFPDTLLLCFPKQGHGLERDFKWTGSHRYGIVHLGARDRAELQARTDHASALLGWPSPNGDLSNDAAPVASSASAQPAYTPHPAGAPST
jgi:hypothetical protein